MSLCPLCLCGENYLSIRMTVGMNESESLIVTEPSVLLQSELGTPLIKTRVADCERTMMTIDRAAGR